MSVDTPHHRAYEDGVMLPSSYTPFRMVLGILSRLMIAVPGLALADVQLNIGLNFTGSTLHLNSENTPPNANGASGLQHYVEIVNGRYAVYDKITGSVVASSTDRVFWSAGGISFAPDIEVSDPRVLFDPLSQRWFASGLDLRRATFEENRLLLGVSRTSNPLDGWDTLAFDPDPATSYFSDFPTLGIDANGVYVGANYFDLGATSAVGKTVVSIPKLDLLSVAPTVANRTGFGLLSGTVGGLTIQPVVNYSPTAAQEHLLGQGPQILHQLRITAIDNASGPGSAVLGSTTIISVPSYGPTGGLLQPDGTVSLKNIDNRLGAMVYEVNGVLYAVQVTQVAGRSAIRWYRVAASTGLPLESGTLSETGVDYSFPSIAANENGVVVIGFNKSSATEFVSSYAVAGKTLAGVTTFDTPLLLKSGVANYHYLPLNGSSRWGDFSSISVDPTDSNVFWTNQEFVSAPDVWSTQITQIRVVPEPNVLSMLVASGLLAATFRGRVRK